MDHTGALLLALLSMVLWGSWANTLLLAKTRFELYFFDYIFGHLIMATIQIGAGIPSLGSALTGGWQGAVALLVSAAAGFIFAFASLLAVAACDLAGMAISTVFLLGIEMSLGVPLLLFTEGFGSPVHWMCSLAGVVIVLAAVAADFVCHSKLDRDRDAVEAAKLTGFSQVERAAVSESNGPRFSHVSERSVVTPFRSKVVNSSLSSFAFRSQAGAGQPGQPEFVRSFLTHGGSHVSARPFRAEEGVSSARRGCIFAMMGGVCFAVWPVASSFVEGQSKWGNPLGPAKLDPSSFFFVYALGAVVAAMALLPPLCKWPIHSGEPLNFGLAYSALPMKVHFLGLLGGFAHGLGSVLSLDSGHVLGNAVSVSIARCQPLVCATWGLLLWGELEGARRGTMCAFAVMICLFAAAVAIFLVAGVADSEP